MKHLNIKISTVIICLLFGMSSVLAEEEGEQAIAEKGNSIVTVGPLASLYLNSLYSSGHKYNDANTAFASIAYTYFFWNSMGLTALANYNRYAEKGVNDDSKGIDRTKMMYMGVMPVLTVQTSLVLYAKLMLGLGLARHQYRDYSYSTGSYYETGYEYEPITYNYKGFITGIKLEAGAFYRPSQDQKTLIQPSITLGFENTAWDDENERKFSLNGGISSSFFLGCDEYYCKEEDGMCGFNDNLYKKENIFLEDFSTNLGFGTNTTVYDYGGEHQHNLFYGNFSIDGGYYLKDNIAATTRFNFNSTSSKNPDTDYTHKNSSVMFGLGAQVHPCAKNNLRNSFGFVEGRIGSATNKNANGYVTEYRDSKLGISLGAGYNWPLADNLGITTKFGYNIERSKNKDNGSKQSQRGPFGSIGTRINF